MKVREVMQTEVLTVRPHTPVKELVAGLEKHGITGVPVVNAEGELVGVVSFSDVARKSAVSDSVHHCEYYVNPSWGTVDLITPEHGDKTVEEIMTKLVLDIDEDADLLQATELMTNFRIHRLIVTRQKKVVGVLSSSDLVKVLRDLLKKGSQS